MKEKKEEGGVRSNGPGTLPSARLAPTFWSRRCVLGAGSMVWGIALRVWGEGCRIWGLWFVVWGLGFRV